MYLKGGKKMSEKYKLNSHDGLKILKGAGIAGAGAVLVYLIQIIPNVDFGAWTPIAVAVGGILSNLVRKYFTNK